MLNLLKKFAKRYRLFLITAVVVGFVSLINVEVGKQTLNISVFQLKQMLLIVPPIFVLLGLLDVWIPRETMVKYMGEGSGLKGILLSFIIAAAAAGPLYGAFPVAAVFMKKGIKFTNLLIFIGTWSTMKIPTLLFEASSLGVKFTLTRFILNIPGIILIAFALAKLIPKNEVEEIYQNAEKLEL
ncbi:putative permease [Anaerotignum neopropionicum]|uniref:Putative permease n=1 Tax=Anaerotignum neopropionicum TaxID=36847 RepID=A0A136WG55_9FIRM|nr:permease [Anaerotignum neopropionicum]KXL53538.1 putative permease [Anaerotignum neopropionicum]